MASGKADYWSQRLLNLLNGATGTIASPLFLALYTVAPTHNSAGTEATGGSYARVSITGNTTNWPTISSGQVMSSGVAFTFPTATADWSSQSNMVAAALLDASSNGNMYYFGALTQAKPVLNGDTASFASAAVTITET